MSNVDSVREQVLPDARQPPLNERRLAAWIGKALLVQGKIVSTENLTIDGSVEGTIELGDHSLTIGPGASIKADLVAQTIIISGAVTGNVKAGDIVAPLLLMAEGAVIMGGVDVKGKAK